MYDILIRGGTVVDGTGTAPYNADIAVNGDTIAAIGNLSQADAKQVIPAEGRMVTPGFIDIHCHSDAIVFDARKNPLRLRQGVTTEVVGNCGISLAPLNPETLPSLRKYARPFFSTVSIPYNWESFGQYLNALEKHHPLLNVAALVGHGTMRIAVADFENRPLTPEETDRMEHLMQESMDAGAFGLSSGLVYPPGLFAQGDELLRLARVVGRNNGIYTTHMRNESAGLIESVRESIALAEEAGVSLEISHHKAHGIDNKGTPKISLRMIRQARQRGVNVSFDVYPYTSCSTTFSTLLPPWAQEGGVDGILRRVANPEDRTRMIRDMQEDLSYENVYRYTDSWEKILVNECAVSAYEGKTVAQIAAEHHRDPFEMALDIVSESRNNAMMIAFTMDEEDVSCILQDPNAMICTDGFASLGRSHPRYTSAFIRVLEKYVKQEYLLSLPEAIHKMTGKPAEKLGLTDRGTLAEGMKADILTLDLAKLHDNADYRNYNAAADGMEFVVINGRIAVKNGELQDVAAGRVLRHHS